MDRLYYRILSVNFQKNVIFELNRLILLNKIKDILKIFVKNDLMY